MKTLFLLIAAGMAAGMAAEPGVVIDKPMAAPTWALLERELLRQSSLACDRFTGKFVDSRGYLLHTPRWGTLDGPDDAIETFHNWTLLHALGGSDSVLNSYKKALEGHLLQYKEMRTVKTKLAENGAYHKEFITQSDWFHTGEGIRGFMFQGLSDPNDPVFRARMKRFAGLYMNEDPEAPNYDPVNRVIKSIWTGSQGPMLHKATTYDWVGDAVPGTFHLLHGKQGRGGMVSLTPAIYDKMLAHCAEYLDSVGDHPLNLASTGLATNAYMLTGEKKYKDWVLQYVGAWKERTDANGGNIPTNIGLNGKPGGEYGGKWYKGTYGWNFTIFDGEIDQMAHRNTFDAGSWPGFGNAYLLSKGDTGFVATLRKQMANLYANKKVVNGRPMLPNGFGDPRGYKFNEKEEWYNWTPNLFVNRLTEIYLWSMDPADRTNIPAEGWLAFLDGKDPSFPEKALRKDLQFVREQVAEMDTDDTSADTRLADYLMGMNPAATDALSKLTLGSYLTGNIWTLHARVRYFDPVKRRSGLPEDVAALVEGFTADSVTVSLVNVNNVEPRVVSVQAGAYGEHSFTSATVGGRAVSVNGPVFQVKLAPGAGDRIVFGVKRYANEATLQQPWDRSWR